MEREPYRVARELLERFDPNNPQLRNTQATSQQQQRRSTNQTPAPGTEVRQRRQPQTPHPALMHRPVVMATPQPRAQPPPVAMATPAANTTNQNAPTEEQNQQTSATQETVGVASSQQFIPPGESPLFTPPLPLPHPLPLPISPCTILCAYYLMLTCECVCVIQSRYVSWSSSWSPYTLSHLTKGSLKYGQGERAHSRLSTSCTQFTCKAFGS